MSKPRCPPLPVCRADSCSAVLITFAQSTGAICKSPLARSLCKSATGFSGFNIRSAQGNYFGANELVSFGLNPQNGSTAILVTGSNQQTIDLGFHWV